MLAARADGVGSSLTSVLLFKNDETLEVLDVPEDQGWRMACCVSHGLPVGASGVLRPDCPHTRCRIATPGEPPSAQRSTNPSGSRRP